jgi:hypothetical protein
MTVRSHPSPTALEADIKTFPSPLTTERTDGYIKERVFENFQNFREKKFKMSEPRFWVFGWYPSRLYIYGHEQTGHERAGHERIVSDRHGYPLVPIILDPIYVYIIS